MSKQLNGLADYIGTDHIIRVNRSPIDPHELHGFVIGISAKLLLLQEIDGNTLYLNGYSAVRVADVRSYRFDPTFTARAMRLMGRKPTLLKDVDLTNWQTLLQSVQFRYPLLMIETEKKKSGVCFVGRVGSLTSRNVEFIEVNAEGYWAETETFAFEDITQIGFDNGYVDGLALLVAHEDANKNRNGREPITTF